MSASRAASAISITDRSVVEPHRSLTVETVSDFSAFLKLETEWNGLLQASGLQEPFLTHEWIRTWWESFGEDKRLNIIVVRDGEAAIAIAPLMFSDEVHYGVKMRTLGFIQNVHTPRFDCIVGRRQDDVYPAIWKALVDRKEEWDLLHFRQIPEESPSLVHLARLAAEDGLPTHRWLSSRSPYLTLQGSWAEYLASLDSKHRSNLRNRLKRIGRLGTVALERISSGAQAEGALDEGLQIEAAAWKSDAGTAIRSAPEVSRFYRGLLGRAAVAGWLRLHFLVVRGRRIAFDYSLEQGGTSYLLKPGYDPEFSQFSPYNLLLSMVLEEAFNGETRRFDFLGQDDPWKMQWTDTSRSHYWLTVFGDSARARLVRFAKFQVVPRLSRYRLYQPVRDALAAAARSRAHPA